MTYFRNFASVDYKFGNNTTTTPYTNISQYSTILDQIEDNSSAYRLVQVQDGERPDQLSQRLYDTTDHYWSFFLLNPGIKEHGWPCSESELLNKVQNDVPGVCMVFFGNDTNPTTGYTQQITVGKFPVGGTVTGQTSGATGTIYGKNSLLGQVFVKDITGTFQANEVIDSGDFNVTVSIVQDAYLAIHHVEDGNGNNIDVDYSTDFRGRPAEDPEVLGGVFDDAAYPDIYAVTSPYTTVTYLESYIQTNDKVRKLKVLKPGIAAQVQKMLRESLRNG
jgi:hypothetical protein